MGESNAKRDHSPSNNGKAVIDGPQETQVEQRIGEAERLLAQGEHSQATGVLRSCLQELKFNDQSVIDRCRCLMLLGTSLRETEEWEEAESVFATAIRAARNERVPDSLRCDIFCRYGELLFRLHKDSLALRWLRRAERRLSAESSDRQRCRTWIKLADALNANGHERAAERRLRMALLLVQRSDIDPLTHCHALQSLGRVLADRDRHTEAQTHLREAARIADQTPLSQLTRCNVYRTLGNSLCDSGAEAEGETWLRQSAALAEGSPTGTLTQFNAIYSLGQFLNQQGRYAEAEPWFRKALDLTARGQIGRMMLCMASWQLGEALAEQQKNEEAEHFLRQASELLDADGISKSTTYSVLVALSAVLATQGKEADAEPVMRRLIDVVSGDGYSVQAKCDVLQFYADTLLIQNKYAAAEEWFRRALEFVDHEDTPLSLRWDVLRGLSDALGGQHDFIGAEKYLRRALSEDDGEHDDPEGACKLWLNLGEILAAQGRHVEAQSWFQQARNATGSLQFSGSTQFNVCVLIGDFEREQGRANDAEVDFRHALAIVDEHELDEEARCTALLGLTHALREQHQAAEARDCLMQAAQLVDAGARLNPLTLCNVQLLRGEFFMAEAAFAPAELCFREAARLAEVHGLDPLSLLNACSQLGEVLGRQGRPEAEHWLSRASKLLELQTFRPVTRCNVYWTLGQQFMRGGGLKEALAMFAAARDELLVAIRQNRWPAGIGVVLSKYGGLFEAAEGICESLWHESDDVEFLWQLIDFTDSERCVSIREGLRRQVSFHDSTRRKKVEWRSNGDRWRELFLTISESTSPTAASAVRGLSSTLRSAAFTMLTTLPELPIDEVDAPTIQYSRPIHRDEIAALLPDPNTVLLIFRFVRDRLLVLPIRKSPEGEPQIFHKPDGLFVCDGARQNFASLVSIQLDLLDYIFTRSDSGAPLAGRTAAEIRARGGEMRSGLYADLYRLLNWEDILALVEPERDRWHELHLILVPDGDLFRLPLHAAYNVPLDTVFYEQVASLRYAMSLRTLNLQRSIPEPAAEVSFRGVIFANPDRSVDQRTRLPDVITEVSNLVGATSADAWLIHGDVSPEAASQANFAEHHASGNLLWCVGHGCLADEAVQTTDGRTVHVTRPSVLLCDGPLTDSRMISVGAHFERLDLLHLSCCVLGQLHSPDDTREIEGFLASLTLLGCRRMTSALWPLSDCAAAEFAKHFIVALQQRAFKDVVREPHSFALALKDAVNSFRKAEDGRFNHECYWAPYTLFGLG